MSLDLVRLSLRWRWRTRKRGPFSGTVGGRGGDASEERPRVGKLGLLDKLFDVDRLGTFRRRVTSGWHFLVSERIDPGHPLSRRGAHVDGGP